MAASSVCNAPDVICASGVVASTKTRAAHRVRRQAVLGHPRSLRLQVRMVTQCRVELHASTCEERADAEMALIVRIATFVCGGARRPQGPQTARSPPWAYSVIPVRLYRDS